MKTLKDKKLFLMDMDGTIYRDNDLFPDSKAFFRRVREMGAKYVFMTNNSSKGAEDYIAKLKRMGIDPCEDDFITSADATQKYLLENHRELKIYVCGTESFKRQLRKNGLDIAESASEEVGCVLMGYDTELTYQKLEDVCILLQRDIPYIASHPDLVCPTRYGAAPDCGSVCRMIFNCTGKEPLIIGKPQPAMPEMAIAKFNCSKEETVIIGDRLTTDIAGIDSILVLTGDGTREEAAAAQKKPTYIFEDIGEVLREISR